MTSQAELLTLNFFKKFFELVTRCEKKLLNIVLELVTRNFYKIKIFYKIKFKVTNSKN